jgi:hypothetical protein
VNEETGPAQEKENQALDESPAGLQRRWLLRLNAAKDFFKDFQDDGDKVVDEFLGKRRGGGLNLFYGDVKTKEATLSGLPKVRAKRRYADANDRIARVSALALERLLNTDIERESDGYRTALTNAKGDWLRPGLGQVWLRYVVETEPTKTEDPEKPGTFIEGTRKKHEDVETDHVKWRRFLWDPAETWEDVQAIYRCVEMTRAQWEKEFPDREFHVSGMTGKGKRDEIKLAFGRAEVWEIWDKETRRVLHLAEEEIEILKVTPDPYGLPGFFPCPMPLMANRTSSKCLPRSSYYLAKDQYEEAHRLQFRIRRLVEFVRLTYAYDKNNTGLDKLLADASDGKGIPVANWSSFVDKGGMQGAIAFLPTKEIVEDILALSQRLALVKQEIYEITANSDLTRGQSPASKTATAARTESRMFLARASADQDEYARFASEAQRIRTFLLAKFFDEATIVQRANLQSIPEEDKALLPQAIGLLKSDIAQYRIDVDSDTVAMTDYDAVRQERVEGLTALGGYLQQAVPFVQMMAAAGPQLAVAAVKLVTANARWLLAGLKGAEALESDFERFMADLEMAAKQPPPPPPPDPALEREKVKGQVAMQGAQMDMQERVMDHQLKQEEHAMEREKLANQTMAMREQAQIRVAEAHAMPKEKEPRA